MLVHSRASSAPAAWGSRTEIAPTVAPHRNSRAAARAITRLLSETPERTWTALGPRTAATSVLSAASGGYLKKIPQNGVDLAAGVRSDRAQRVVAVREALDLDDEALLEAPDRGAVFADVTAAAPHRLASADVDLVAEVDELIGLELQ